MSLGRARIRNASGLVPKDQRADFLGVLCSAVCALHCAATPLLLSLLPSISTLNFLTDPLLHQSVALVCAVLAARAILPAWKRHRSNVVAVLAAGGLGFLVIAAFILPDNCCDQTHVTTVATSESPRLVSVQARFQAGLGQSVDRDHPIRKSLEKTPSETEAKDDKRLAGVFPQLFGKTLFDQAGLSSTIGKEASVCLLTAQPYFTPMGGLFLILAHILNLRLSCCSREGCSKRNKRNKRNHCKPSTNHLTD